MLTSVKKCLLDKKAKLSEEFDALEKTKQSLIEQVTAIDKRQIELKAQNTIVKELLLLDALPTNQTAGSTSVTGPKQNSKKLSLRKGPNR